MRPPFISGFLGAATEEASVWFTHKLEHHNEARICVPFTGSAKVIAMMADKIPDRLVFDTWDTQMIPKTFVDGIFNSQGEPTIDVPKYKKGVIYNEKPFANIPSQCAGFIDYVGAYGSLYDKACVAAATARSTYRGRMSEWGATDMAQFWKKFVSFQDKFEDFRNLPAQFNHTQGNFYDTSPPKSLQYDVLFVDPPKIITNTDVYNKTFEPLDRALAGTVPFDRWVWRDFVGKMRMVLERVQWNELLFMYTSDVRPTWAHVKLLLEEYGTTLDTSQFSHRSRTDYAIHLVKE